MNNDTLKLAKSQAKANENPKVALLPFEIIYFLDPCSKNKCACFNQTL